MSNRSRNRFNLTVQTTNLNEKDKENNENDSFLDFQCEKVNSDLLKDNADEETADDLIITEIMRKIAFPINPRVSRLSLKRTLQQKRIISQAEQEGGADFASMPTNGASTMCVSGAYSAPHASFKSVASLGKGNGATTELITHVQNPSLSLIKKIYQFDKKPPNANLNFILREIKALQSQCFLSPYLAAYFGAHFEHSKSSSCTARLCVFTEYCGGGGPLTGSVSGGAGYVSSVAQLLERANGGRLPEPIICRVVCGVVAGLAHLRQLYGIAHRNLKPANILIHTHSDTRGHSSSGGIQIKLADFGLNLAPFLANSFVSDRFCYLAPETIVMDPIETSSNASAIAQSVTSFSPSFHLFHKHNHNRDTQNSQNRSSNSRSSSGASEKSIMAAADNADDAGDVDDDATANEIDVADRASHSAGKADGDDAIDDDMLSGCGVEDVWSLGVCALEMAIGRFPFPAPSRSDWSRVLRPTLCENVRQHNMAARHEIILQGVENSNWKSSNSSSNSSSSGASGAPLIFDMLSSIVESASPRLPDHGFSEDFVRFIAQCLVKSAAQRISLASLLRLPFVQRQSCKAEQDDVIAASPSEEVDETDETENTEIAENPADNDATNSVSSSSFSTEMLICSDADFQFYLRSLC